ncbi:MAG TPA: class I SAM-dependent methyltransferase [Cyclobacteriaceae bacterium]|nr:class I SAM-dependent methyltransferase [Cyclobacteriaceae bacterium]
MSQMIIPEKWGFCMAGNEEVFCQALDIAIKATIPGAMPISFKETDPIQEPVFYSGPFVYYEIGIGNADTMLAVHSWLSQRMIQHKIVGVDLPNYQGGAINYNFNEQPSATFGEIRLALVGAAEFLASCEEKANFAFIDACHGAPCVTNDFLGVEKLIKPGGIVMFHDTDPNCQGIHFQEHCATGIEARAAVEKLGLLDDSRPGWKKLFETHGDKSKSGHGALWVQKLTGS